jgi:hypothetical protein
VGAGVYDDGAAANSGIATVISCSNVSGLSAQVRVLVLNDFGGVAGSLTTTVAHGASATFATHPHIGHIEANLSTGQLVAGAVLNVEATQSGLFCTAAIANASGQASDSSPLHLVRVNPHPGTVE